MGEIVTKTHKEILRFFDEMKKISTLVDALKSSYSPSLNGERFLTDTELSEMLKLTKRTLLEYRNCGKIPIINSEEKYSIGKAILRNCYPKIAGDVLIPFEICLKNVQTIFYRKRPHSIRQNATILLLFENQLCNPCISSIMFLSNTRA